ncbi:MAG: RNA polymerase factor sigma-54 [Treponema sp.]|jgi:RNA polymerase sigma-54 factor|nr:RNA polymerase factor sigma-54 [Treponema sp.]
MQLQRPSFIQEQRLRMNPQLYQAIKLMELPIADLREKIEEEIERNPALEIVEDRTTVSLDAAVSSARREEDDYFETASDSGFARRGAEEAADEKQRFIEGILTRPETLQEHLLWQLQLEALDGDMRRICETLIRNLDADGFHKEQVKLLFSEKPGDPAPARLGEALELVRSLDPQGTCTEGYLESLRVQIGLRPDIPPEAEELLAYLEPLDRGKTAEVARKLNRSEAELCLLLERIRELSPFPGRRFSSGETRYVVPDVQVVRKEGEFALILNGEEIPVLGINPFFMKLAVKPKRGAGREGGKDSAGEERVTRDFVRENIREARWFIQSVNRRNHTLLKVSRAIVEFQRSFFTNGPKHLSPLTLGDIAQELDVHETTVSRTANGKYMETEWGIFELRYFFTNSISGAGSRGSKYSKEGVKEVIREIIAGERGNLSDRKIAELLAKRGISLARRTVAKYRGELDLGSSYAR